MIVELVYLQIYWINFFIPKDYISTTLSPGSIVTGRAYDYNMVCGPGSQFQSYVRTHESTDNTMAPRIVNVITLRPTANTKGSFYYYSLATGQRLIRRRCTLIPMSDEIITRVHFIATKQKQPNGFMFTRMDSTHIPLVDDNDEAAQSVGEIINEVINEVIDDNDDN